MSSYLIIKGDKNMAYIYRVFNTITFVLIILKEMLSLGWCIIMGYIHDFFIQKSKKKGSWLCKNYSVLYKNIHMDAIFLLRLISVFMMVGCAAIRLGLPDCLESLLLAFIEFLYNPKTNKKRTLSGKLKSMQFKSYKLEEIWFIHEFLQATIRSSAEMKNDKGEVVLPLITLFQHRDEKSETYATFHHLGFTEEGRSAFDIIIWLNDIDTFKLHRMLDMVDDVNKKMHERYFSDKIKDVFNITTNSIDANHAKVVINFEMEAYTREIYNDAKLSLMPVE